MGNNVAKMSAAEWRGYVSAKLERIPILENKVDGLMWKVAGIGATVALVTTLVVNLVFK